MFGLTFEKLFVVAILAAVIIGPRRLPDYAARLGALIRRVTVMASDARHRVVQEADVADWRALDPRQYDPRRIIREAWADAEAETAAGAALDVATAQDAAEEALRERADAVSEAPVTAGHGRWVVS